MIVRIVRVTSDDQGTFGRMVSSNFECFTAEPPWRDNKSNISCIPDGIYKVIPRYSPRFGWTYYVKGIPKRNCVLLHSGNFAGDVSKGFITHTHGCILQGTYLGILKGQKAILASSVKVKEFWCLMNREEFELEIMWKADMKTP